MVFRKSWTTFVAVAVRICFWLVVTGVVLVYKGDWQSSMLSGGTQPGTVRIIFLIIFLFIAYRIARLIWHFFWLRSFRINVGQDIVAVRHGILPWKKFHRSWDGDQMHECLMNSDGFMNWLLRTGDLIIVGSEGSTHKYTMSRIGSISAACGAINQMRRNSRAARG